MSQDPNKGPIYSVALPEDLPIRNGWTQAVPRREELELVRKRVGDRTVGALEVALATIKAMSDDLSKIHDNHRIAQNKLLERSGFGLSPCPRCGNLVIGIPDRPSSCKGRSCGT